MYMIMILMLNTETESDDDSRHRKATKSKGKAYRRCRGSVKLRKGHPYVCRSTPVVSYNTIVGFVIQ